MVNEFLSLTYVTPPKFDMHIRGSGRWSRQGEAEVREMWFRVFHLCSVSYS